MALYHVTASVAVAPSSPTLSSSSSSLSQPHAPDDQARLCSASDLDACASSVSSRSLSPPVLPSPPSPPPPPPPPPPSHSAPLAPQPIVSNRLPPRAAPRKPPRPPPPPRADSPTPVAHDARFRLNARLTQICVWRDGALDVRELNSAPRAADIRSQPPPPVPQRPQALTALHAVDVNAFSELGYTHPSQRAPDRTRPSMYSLIQAHGTGVTSAKGGMIRRKSLFGLSKSALRSACTPQQQPQPAAAAPQWSPPSQPRSSFRRRASVHRYMRIGAAESDVWCRADCDLDELMHGLDATQVVETALPQHS